MTPTKTKFFARTREVNVWNVFEQAWTGRTPAARIATNTHLLATLPAAERDRIRRMAASRPR
jgi:hypothetical protein